MAEECTATGVQIWRHAPHYSNTESPWVTLKDFLKMEEQLLALREQGVSDTNPTSKDRTETGE